ncbi:hypothetical protein [Persephonella sp.]
MKIWQAIFLGILMFFYFSPASIPQISWREPPETFGSLTLKTDCGKLKIYQKNGRFDGFRADRVYYSFYLNRLYKITLNYSSFYDFMEDARKISSSLDVNIIDVKVYEKGSTIIKITHTPFKNSIEFIYKLYYPRLKLIEKCN